MAPKSTSQAESVAREVAEASLVNGDSNGAPESPTANQQVNPPVRPSALKRLKEHILTRRTLSAPPSLRRRNNKPGKLMEEHFVVDKSAAGSTAGSTGKPVVLPGVPKQDDNWARDLHDFFNLIALVPVVAANCMNWNWDMLLHQEKSLWQMTSLGDAWTGDYFYTMFYLTATYFVTDLLWMLVAPHCVRSPMVIVQHHVATLLYILIPYQVPAVHWVMGACMSVEVNTWLLIARRVFNKQGFPPWTIIDMSFLSIRIKLISFFFYVTWISIRCILYPYLLFPIWDLYKEHTEEVGSSWNLLLVCFPLHAVFCALNLKWSYDLLMSKVRYWTRSSSNGGDADNAKDKGL